MSDLTLNEIKTMKVQFEKDISILIRKFEKDTGIEIDEIKIRHIMEMTGPELLDVKVSVNTLI
jgi:hypothetical protein